MKPETQKENKSARRKGNRSTYLLIPVLLIVVVGLLFFIVSKQEESTGSPQQPGTHYSIWKKITRTFTGDTDQAKVETTKKIPGKTSSSGTETAGGEKNRVASTQQEGNENTGTVGKSTAAPETSSPSPTSQNNEHSTLPAADSLQTILSGKSNSCQQAADKINAFYAHLDSQPYIQAFHLGKKSRVYFSELIQKLLDNPPVITRETDDLFTVLKNTAHFYRVIGKNNITIIKTILDKEKPYIENTLADFYLLSEFPDCLQKSFPLHIPAYSIYDYAGFFLNTMGGRLYLFRRDSVSRMTVSYYGVLVIDNANKESNNRDGIQIKQAIDSLISEMETSGNQLRLKDKYLDKLYDLKEKYQ
jgi:hypothetical protein